MDKLAEIRMNACIDELEKIAGPGTFLAKTLPKLMMRYLGKKKITSSKTLKGVFETLGKARRGDWSKVKTLSETAKPIKGGAGRALDTAEEWATRKEPFMGNKWSLKERMRKFGPRRVKEKTKRTFFGLGGKAKGVERVTKQKMSDPKEAPLAFLKEKAKGVVGNPAREINLARRKGVGKYVKHKINRGRVFERDGVLYRRSLAGQAGSAAFSGPGFGVLAATQKTDRQGKELSIPKRLMRGVGTGAAWSIAPGAAITYELSHMLKKKDSKNILQKQKQQLQEKNPKYFR